MVVGLPLFLVGVVGGRQDLLVRQDAGDLVGAFAAGAQVEDALHHRRGFLVGDDLLAVRRFPAVAVGRPAAETLTALRLELFHRPNLFAGILGVQLICPVSDGIEVGAALHQGVHSIIDGDEADALRGQIEFCQLAHLQILAAQAGHILDDQRVHLVRFDHLNDLFPGRPLEVRPAVTIVRQEYGVFKTIISSVFLQQQALVYDRIRIAHPGVLLTEPSVENRIFLACHFTVFLLSVSKPVR